MNNLHKVVYIVATLCFGCTSLHAQLNLDDYKAKVLDYSWDLKSSKNQADQAKESVRLIKTNFYPHISLDASANYNFFPTELMGATMKGFGYSAELTLMQPVYAGGALSGQHRSAQKMAEAADLLSQFTTDNVLMYAEITYWQTVAGYAFYQSALKFDSLVKALYVVVKRRFDEGLISKTDLLKVETRLSESQLQVSTSLQNYTIAKQYANILMGVSSETDTRFTLGIDQETASIAVMSMEDVLAQRADYRAAELQVDAQYEAIRAVHSKYNPQIYVGVKESIGTSLFNLDGKSLLTTVAFAQLSFPIISWGARHRDVDIARLQTLEAQYQRDALSDQINHEINSTWVKVLESQNQIAIAKQSFQIAEESMNLHIFSYQEGSIPILDVLTAQFSWLQACNSLIQSLLQHKSSVAEYRKATAQYVK